MIAKLLGMNFSSCDRRKRKTLRWLLVALLTTLLMVSGVGIFPVLAQLPDLKSTVSQNLLDPPKGVKRIGEFEVTSVNSPLDGSELFTLASPTILNRDKIDEDNFPVEMKAEEISDRLSRMMKRVFQSNETPIVRVSTLNNRLIIEISDDKFERPVRLVTVTEPDAEYSGKSTEMLADEWQKSLQAEVDRMKHLFSPEEMGRRFFQVFQILLGLLICSAVIWFLRRQLTQREKKLETRYQRQLEDVRKSETLENSKTAIALDEVLPEGGKSKKIKDLRSQFVAEIQYQLSVKRQLEIDKFLQWILFWFAIAIWYVGIYLILTRIPFLMKLSTSFVATPLLLIVLWFMISFAIRLSSSLIDRIMDTWVLNPSISLGETQRTALRATTVSSALKGLANCILLVVGILWTLGLFNIPTGSILAGGAVIGLAISFGSQSLIKDIVNGCLILLEDQYAIGDVIQIGEKGGLVEKLNLRVTQLRNGEGKLITIPNSNITDVSNLTRLWSRVDFSIVVDYKNDPQKVLAVLKEVSQALYDDPLWRDHLVELPEVLGIDHLSWSGMLVRVWIKTMPMEQWSVGREFRLRVRQGFEVHNIHIGKPEFR
jgi:small-conductance mechanosensitive channel